MAKMKFRGFDGNAELALHENAKEKTFDFVKTQSIGAMSNTTRVRKVKQERGDYIDDGTEGAIVGSVSVPLDVATHPKFGDIMFMYFIEWEGYDNWAFACVDAKLERV